MSGTGTAPCVRLEGLGKDFGATRALDAVTLDIAEGELYCLLGGSGCGKSTLLRLVAGFETPSRGRVLIDGSDVSAVPPYRRPVNLMFQSYALFPHLTVAANVAFGLRQEGLPRAEIARRVAAMLALVHLEPQAGRRPQQLSGGQRQRVALARALVKRPRLLLLDEPLAALDRKLREATRLELVRIQRELGTTFVMVTHDQEEAMSLATRIGVMTDGRIVQSGAPHAIYERPVDRYVADFVGNANLLEVRITSRDDASVTLTTALAPAPLRAPATGAPRAEHGWLLLRPEQLAIAHADASAVAHTDNTLGGVIEDIAYVGDRWLYAVRLADASRWRVSEPNTLHRGHGKLVRGAPVTLRWPSGSGVVLAS